jgi:hypothetical protein
MNRVMEYAAHARKFLVAVGALVAALVAGGLLSGDAADWVSGVIGALGAFLVYYVPNDQPGAPDVEA